MHRFICIGIILLLSHCQSPQNDHPKSIVKTDWLTVNSHVSAHLRGLDQAQDGTIWASGVDGTVLRSLDTGQTWQVVSVPNCIGTDFRDIEAFDQKTAAVLSAGNGVRIYRTSNAGATWSLVYEDTDSNKFFDGFDFNSARGIAYGDPIDGKFSLLETNDSCKSWTAFNRSNLPSSFENEAGFAASGTGIVLGKSRIWIAASGGEVSRVFRSSADGPWMAVETPLSSGKSAGIFSMAFVDEMHGIVVGGDYIDSANTNNAAAYTSDGGTTWKKPERTTTGYRSCVTMDSSGLCISTGKGGSDISLNFGQSWESLSSDGYYSCVYLKPWIVATGRSGKIGRMNLSERAKL